MLEDAQRKKQQSQSNEERQRELLADLATRQHREIAEFISAMGQLGVAPRTYGCFSVEGQVVKMKTRTRESLQGWHIGSWRPEHLTMFDMTPRKPAIKRSGYKKSDDIDLYTVITTSGAVRRNDGYELQIPYIEPAHYDDASDPEHLKKMMQYAVDSIVKILP